VKEAPSIGTYISTRQTESRGRHGLRQCFTWAIQQHFAITNPCLTSIAGSKAKQAILTPATVCTRDERNRQKKSCHSPQHIMAQVTQSFHSQRLQATNLKIGGKQLRLPVVIDWDPESYCEFLDANPLVTLFLLMILGTLSGLLANSTCRFQLLDANLSWFCFTVLDRVFVGCLYSVLPPRST